MTDGAPRVAGLVLAGGEGRRLGGADKALVTLAGRPLLDHCLARLAPQVLAIAISANGDPGRFGAAGLPVLADATRPDAQGRRPGPLAGVLSGLDWARAAGMTHLAVQPVDTPFLPSDWVGRLSSALARAGHGEVALAETADGLHPACSLWTVAVADTVRAALARGERRLGEVAAAIGCIRVVFPAGEAAAFLNINTPGDLAQAEARLAGIG